MSQAISQPVYLPEAYLRNEETETVKHEYVQGEVYAMAGAGERHNRIAVNLAMVLRLVTRGSRCGTYIADMKLRLHQQNAFYYPDVMLVCQAEDDHPLYKTSPCILVEVLSPSTANIDRREKLLAYRTIPSLQAYLMVDSEQRQVDYCVRTEGGAWARGQLEAGEVLTLRCANFEIPFTLAEIYEDVGF